MCEIRASARFTAAARHTPGEDMRVVPAALAARSGRKSTFARARKRAYHRRSGSFAFSNFRTFRRTPKTPTPAFSAPCGLFHGMQKCNLRIFKHFATLRALFDARAKINSLIFNHQRTLSWKWGSAREIRVASLQSIILTVQNQYYLVRSHHKVKRSLRKIRSPRRPDLLDAKRAAGIPFGVIEEFIGNNPRLGQAKLAIQGGKRP